MKLLMQFKEFYLKSSISLPVVFNCIPVNNPVKLRTTNTGYFWTICTNSNTLGTYTIL